MSRRVQPSGVFLSPEWDDAIREALMESVQMELRELDAQPEPPELGEFSRHFQARMEQIIPQASRRYTVLGRHTVRRAALIAAILTLILASAAAVIALTLPQIHYWIVKSNISWDVWFHQDDPDGLVSEEFQVIRPTLPEGFEVVEEELIPGRYHLELQNESGNEILLSQYDANSVGITLDSETGTIEERVFKDHTYILQQDGDSYTLLFDNGYYVFLLSGDCPWTILEQIEEEIIDRTL